MRYEFLAFIWVRRHCEDMGWYSALVIYTSSSLHPSSFSLQVYTEWQSHTRGQILTPYFQQYGRREQFFASHPCMAHVLCESWCLAVIRKQLTVNKECLLTGRSSKFKVEPLPWLRRMHSLLGEGSGWCPATAKNMLYRSALSRTLFPFSFPLRSRTVYRWWQQWRVESTVATSGACRNAASAKCQSSHLIGVIGKHIIPEFMSALHRFHLWSLKTFVF